MKRVMRYFPKSSLTFVFIILLFAGGCAAKKLRKQAQKLEESGLVEDAADLYRRSLLKKRDNVEAKLGLRKTGQVVLDRKADQFLKAYNTGTSQAAVYAFRDAQKYYDLVKFAGVTLDFPESHRTYYEDKKAEYLESRYLEGRKQLDGEQFEDAQRTFSEIISFDAQFKDSKRKLDISRMEPLYRKGEEALDQQRPRSAYYLFKKVLAIDPSYKDAQVLKQDAQQAATIRVVLVPFANESECATSKRQKLQSEVQSSIQQIRSPFLQFIDGQTISAYDDQKLEKARKLGGHAILTGTIFQLEALEGRMYKKTEKAYKKIVKEVEKEDGSKEEKVSYQKITYDSFHKQNKANLSMRFKLISTQDKQIWLTNSVNISNGDEVNYARSEFNFKSLVPGYWEYTYKASDSDKVNTSSYSIRKFRKLFKSDNRIASASELLYGLMDEAGKRVQRQLSSFNPEEKASYN
ncbi:MAG: hypothetical protein MI784_00715 [Cytophagales bacterium]|nr:hypothetical protein [Cytophagales bacterium]